MVLFRTMRIALQKWAKPRPLFRGNFGIFEEYSKYPRDLKVVLLPLAPTPAPSHKIQNEGPIGPQPFGGSHKGNWWAEYYPRLHFFSSLTIENSGCTCSQTSSDIPIPKTEHKT